MSPPRENATRPLSDASRTRGPRTGCAAGASAAPSRASGGGLVVGVAPAGCFASPQLAAQSASAAITASAARRRRRSINSDPIRRARVPAVGGRVRHHMKWFVAVVLAGALIAVAVWTWRGGSGGAPPAPVGTLSFSDPDFGDIFVARVGGAEVRRLTSTRGPQFDPSFSPDGQRIAYRDSRRGINVDDEIWVMDADGSDATNLTHHRADDWSPAWSPDGDTIAFASTRSGSLRLWTMAADGSHPTRLTRSPGEYPSWSPDGSRIAFSVVSAGAVQIGVIGRDGGGEHTITPITENSELPAWSPDGSRIAFCRGFEGERSIWTMRPDGSDARALPRTSSDDVGPAWSPDGRFIAFARRGELMVVRPDGSSERALGIRGVLPTWTAAPATRRVDES
jgi:Tol biopolymer transport system component